MYDHDVKKKEAFPMFKEKMDIYAYRTVYDIIQNNKDI